MVPSTFLSPGLVRFYYHVDDSRHNASSDIATVNCVFVPFDSSLFGLFVPAVFTEELPQTRHCQKGQTNVFAIKGLLT